MKHEIVLYHVNTVPTEVLERALDLGKASLPRDYRPDAPVDEEDDRPLNLDEQPEQNAKSLRTS
jgi:hypothetical protein